MTKYVVYSANIKLYTYNSYVCLHKAPYSYTTRIYDYSYISCPFTLDLSLNPLSLSLSLSLSLCVCVCVCVPHSVVNNKLTAVISRVSATLVIDFCC